MKNDIMWSRLVFFQILALKEFKVTWKAVGCQKTKCGFTNYIQKEPFTLFKFTKKNFPYCTYVMKFLYAQVNIIRFVALFQTNINLIPFKCLGNTERERKIRYRYLFDQVKNPFSVLLCANFFYTYL